MPTAIDLERLSNSLPEKYQREKRLMMQLVGAISALVDLNDAKIAFDIFWDHHKVVISEREKSGSDDNVEAFKGRCYFLTAMALLSRALDDGSHGRNRVPFADELKKQGLGASYDECDKFRNKELAHFGGYEHQGNIYSDNRAALVLGKTSFFIKDYRTSWNSSSFVADHAMRILEKSIEFCDEYRITKMDLIVRSLINKRDLLQHIIDIKESCSFDPYEFFADRVEADKLLSSDGIKLLD